VRPLYGEYFARMTACNHAVLRVPDDAFLVNDKSRTLNALADRSVHVAWLHDLVTLANFAIHVGQQIDTDPVMITEIGVRETVVRRDAENGGFVMSELIEQIGEFDGFLRTYGTAVLDVEEKHHAPVPCKVGERDIVHVSVWQCKYGRRLAYLEHDRF
jgi:hypothetical protein